MRASTLTGAVVGLAVMAGGYQAHAETSFSIGGDVEIDTVHTANSGGGSDDDSDMSGRVKLVTSGMHESDRGYVKGVGQVLLGKDGGTSVDDMYVRFGSGNFGVQIGRFQGTNLHPKGPDAAHSLIGSSNHYSASTARGRMSDTGQIMIDATAGAMKFELGTIWGESDDATTDEDSISGIRPVIVWSATDSMSITLGYEDVENAGVETSGYGLSVAYSGDSFGVTLNYASGEQESGGVTAWENTSYNINMTAGNFGFGYTRSEADGGDSADALYGRYVMSNFMGVESASASINVGVSGADSVAEDQTIIKFRVNYTF